MGSKRRRDDATHGAVSSTATTASTESAGDPPRLTRSQLKNRSKRLRARRPCHRCGRAGHKRSECSASSVDLLPSAPTASVAAMEAEGGDGVQCLGCRRFGHRLSECDNITQQHKPTLTAADALLQHSGDGSAGSEMAGADETAGRAVAERTEKEAAEVIASAESESTRRRAGRFCYHCGSAGHTAAHCDGQLVAGSGGGGGGGGGGGQFAFAVCFICQSVGHLARQCPSSDHGIFVRGGECHRCGSKQHKAKHCSHHTTQQAEGGGGGGEEGTADSSTSRLSMQQLGLSKPKRQSRERKRSCNNITRSAAPPAQKATVSSASQLGSEASSSA